MHFGIKTRLKNNKKHLHLWKSQMAPPLEVTPGVSSDERSLRWRGRAHTHFHFHTFFFLFNNEDAVFGGCREEKCATLVISLPTRCPPGFTQRRRARLLSWRECVYATARAGGNNKKEKMVGFWTKEKVLVVVVVVVFRRGCTAPPGRWGSGGVAGDIRCPNREYGTYAHKQPP